MSRCAGFSGIVAALGILTLTTAAHADEIYSTFGPGDTYQNAIGWTISGSTSPVGNAYSIAASFSVAQNYNLTSIDVASFYVTGMNSFVYSIVADNAGAPTGSSLWSLTTPISNGINTFGASGSLLAGNTYWLVMEPGNADTWGAWNHSSVASNGFSTQQNGGAWTDSPGGTSPTFRVNGTTVRTALTPEMPAGVQAIPVLLAVGGMALYQRKKKATRTDA